MNQVSKKQLNTVAFLISALFLGASLFLEYYKALAPCPFCLLQRYVLIALIVVFFVAMFHANTRLRYRCYGVLTGVMALLGAGISMRHAWLQQHPKEALMGVCAPLPYLFKQLPFFEAVKVILTGGSSCAVVNGQFIGLTIPAWALLGFLLLFVISVLQVVRKYS